MEMALEIHIVNVQDKVSKMADLLQLTRNKCGNANNMPIYGLFNVQISNF